jgi:threonine-phosphate decarboxylase
MTVHGGDIWQIGEDLGIAPSDLLDFSANINPRGLPPRARERLMRNASDPRLLAAYPDPSARHLRGALSRYLKVHVEAIVIGPGAEALLSPILRCLQPRTLLVPVPAFSEYRRVCEQNQIEFIPFPFGKPADLLKAEAILLNSPHNPSGALLEQSELHRVLNTGVPLILDEAFIDYAPYASLVRDAAHRRNLIVLRSLTKFYGCPALRVGYAVAHPEMIRRIQSSLPTWPVTQLALDALTEAIADTEYAQATLRDNTEQREQLTRELTSLALKVFPSAANYLLLELGPDMPTSANLRARLIANHRILIRNCDSYEGLAQGRYIRVAVRTGEENQRLTAALIAELRLP